MLPAPAASKKGVAGLLSENKQIWQMEDSRITLFAQVGEKA